MGRIKSELERWLPSSFSRGSVPQRWRGRYVENEVGVTVFLAGVIGWVPVMQPIVACAESTFTIPGGGQSEDVADGGSSLVNSASSEISSESADETMTDGSAGEGEPVSGSEVSGSTETSNDDASNGGSTEQGSEGTGADSPESSEDSKTGSSTSDNS